MELNEIQDLIKFVAKSNVSEVELETKGFKLVVKNKAPEAQQVVTVTAAAPLAAAVQQAVAPAPVAAAPAAPVAAAGAAEAGPAAEQDLILVDAGASKINVIKIVREVLGLGLMEAKAFVDTPGGTIKAGASADEIADLTAKFAEAGAKVEAK